VSKLSQWKVAPLLSVFCWPALIGWPVKTFTALASFIIAKAAIPLGSTFKASTATSTRRLARGLAFPAVAQCSKSPPQAN
jgi:hypothetical protein